jgi:hypothetical protein
MQQLIDDIIAVVDGRICECFSPRLAGMNEALLSQLVKRR